MTASPPVDAPLPPDDVASDIVRVKLSEEDLSYDAIRAAIYAQAQYLFEKGGAIGHLFLSNDLFEILDRRLVFSTAAHKERPHFITPYGNLQVERMDPSLDEPLSFIIGS